MTVSSMRSTARGGPRPASEAAVLAHADVLFANEAEAARWPGRLTRMRLELLAAHCPASRSSAARRGALGIRAGTRSAVPADPVDVVDTTGAGDCFNAGFLAGWLVWAADLEGSLTLGVICGSGAATDFGGYRGCPHAEEVRAIAAARGVDVPESWAPAGEPA